MSKVSKKVNYLQKGMFFFAVLLVIVTLIGCVGDTDTVVVESVSIDGGNTGVIVGTPKTLTATVSPNDATDSSVTWSSSNEDIAMIANTGVVVGVAEGEVTITVTTTDGGFTDGITLTVVLPNLDTATFSYAADLSTGYGQAGKSVTPTWTDEVATPSALTYAIEAASINGPQTNGVTANVVSIDELTGEVTTTTTAEVVHNGNYVITAIANDTDVNYASGTQQTATIVISVNPASVSALSGYTDVSVGVDTAIADQNPTVTPSGATGAYAILPGLPTGLSLDTSTGTISGTPTVGPSSTTYTITFTANGNYTGTPSQSFMITVLMVDAPPGAPTIGTLIVGNTQVTVPWTAPTNTGYNGGVVATITGYTVYYSTVEDFTKDNAEGNVTTHGAATEIVVDGLTNGTTHYFLVTAMSNSGEGESSAIISIAVPYFVGDIGPAGGIIFYDKGSESEGWRYLEAATSDQDTFIAWGESGTEVAGTSTDIGTGQANTTKIVTEFGLDSSYAARICSDLELGGYDDWFLPSRDELSELYQQRVTVGNFASGYYWSSSDGNSTTTWCQQFDDTGWRNPISKSYATDTYVRAVRAF